MKSVLIGLPTFVGRHWLRIIIVGAALVLISRKQINFNVRLGSPVELNLPVSAPAPLDGNVVDPARPKESLSASAYPVKKAEASLPGRAAAPVTKAVPAEASVSILSRLFGSDDTAPVPAVQGLPASETSGGGLLERLGLTGGAAATQPLSAQLFRTDEATVAAYIRRFSHVAKSERGKYGIPASITLANGLLHTSAGTSGSARLANNYYALACKGDWNGPCQALANGRVRAYETAWLSFRNHSVYVTSGRFAQLQQLGPRDYRSWAMGLEHLGFNGTPNLAEQLLATINRYELHRFDE